MVLFFAAALATPAPQSVSLSATAQATATIRVIAAVRLKLDGSANPDAPPPREADVPSKDGTIQTLKLIEFQ
ncbi:MAG: hypothetical protein ACJ8EO_00535 [Sphingomicrobium sp.]